jgi:hypothetical protein
MIVTQQITTVSVQKSIAIFNKKGAKQHQSFVTRYFLDVRINISIVMFLDRPASSSQNSAWFALESDVLSSADTMLDDSSITCNICLPDVKKKGTSDRIEC